MNNTNNDILNKSLSIYFKDIHEMNATVSELSDEATKILYQIYFQNKMFYTREEVQELTHSSRSTVSKMFTDPEFAKSTLGKTEIVHRDALAEYFSVSRSRENSPHWKNK